MEKDEEEALLADDNYEADENETETRHYEEHNEEEAVEDTEDVLDIDATVAETEDFGGNISKLNLY